METTDYAGEFIYKDHHLDHILTGEGRLKWNDDDKVFYAEYFIKDHLGNVRSVITTDPEHHFLAQGTDYYPFGLEIYIYGYSDYNQLKYNAKELQTEADLTWYDYGARFYDPVIGRFPSLDPLADNFVELSPYNYASNNPVTKIDLWGLQGVDFFELGPMLQTESLKATGQRIPTVQDAVQYSDLPEKQAQIDAYTAAGVMGLAEVGGALLEVALPAVAETKLGQAVIKFFGGNADDAAKTTNTAVSNEAKADNLGNPFKGKTVDEVKQGFEKQVDAGKLEHKYIDPVSGSSSYKNTKSGYSYNVDTGINGKTGIKKENAHVVVKYPNPKPKNVPEKRKFDIEEK